jgi:chaperonin GroES
LGDRVLVDVTPVEETTKSGLIVVRSQTESIPTIGTVVAIGRGRYDNGELSPMTVEVGDRVIWGKFAGVNVEIDGRSYLLMHEGDISGVLGTEAG